METPVIVKKEKVDVTLNSVTSTTITLSPKLQVWVKQEIVTLSSDESDADDGQKNVADRGLETLKRRVIVKEEKVVEGIPPAEETRSIESPSTFKVQLVHKHPDIIVENATLASVSVPDVWYKLSLPEEIIDSGALSAVQLEPIIHACQMHKQRLPDGSRAGFLVGDGAGVGKGRIAAGIIVENYVLGRKKSVWISDSKDLKYDVKRDFRDIGAEKIPIFSLRNYDSKMLDCEQGILFATYSALVEEVRSSSGKYQTRLTQLLKWCGVHFDGVIILDECHKGKELFYNDLKRESLILSAILDLQNELLNARIVYICATGVSEPRNLSYMNRLGLWGRGTSFKASRCFVEAVEAAGFMELLGMEMKQRGMYISRQLPFKDVTFEAVEVSLTLKYIQVHDNSVKLWDQLRQSFTKATELVNSSPTMRRVLWSHYWSSHHKYFKYLSISAKVMHAVKIAKKAVKNGKCVVIAVKSTGETFTLEQIKKEGTDGLLDFVSTTKNVLQSLVEKDFPVTGYNDATVASKRKSSYEGDGNTKRKKIEYDPSEFEEEVLGDGEGNNGDSLLSIRNQLFSQIERLGTVLPRNWIDQLIHELGGPQNVAEISNREGRVVQKDNGQIVYESRAEKDVPLDMINIRERARFMEGEKHIAIVSQAVTYGISLHADRRVKNLRPRVFILLEFPSSADLAIQQFGCTHRSNQVSAPEFVILFSELAAERRFASIVAKYLESFGATNCGDRRVIETVDPSEFKIDTKHGTLALESTMRSILGYKDPVVPPPVDYQGDFCKDMSDALFSVGLIKKCALSLNWAASAYPPPYNTFVFKFTNRILGIPMELQTRLYKYFTDTLSLTIHYAKARGDFSSMGIVDIGAGHSIRRSKLQTFTTDIATGTAKIELHRFEIDREMRRDGRGPTKAVGHESQNRWRMRTYDVLCGPVLSVWTDIESIVLNAKGIMQAVRVHVGSKRIIGLLIPSNCEASVADFLERNSNL